MFVSVSLDVKPGRLVAVVGAVGSGKSSLMSALLGEMHCTKGFINIQVMTCFFLKYCMPKGNTVSKMSPLLSAFNRMCNCYCNGTVVFA